MSEQSMSSTKHPDRRKQLLAGLLRQMQRQYGSDAVRTRLIEGELQAAPELREARITPDRLKAVETRVAAAMKDVAIGVGADNRIVLPAVKKERLGRSDSANFSADLRDMASWTQVNKYRSDFFAYELQQEEKTRTAALKKTQDELAHQRREGLAQKAAKKDEVRRAAAEEAERYALYLKDKAADDAKRAAKVKMEGEMRSNQTEERRARRAVEQRLKVRLPHAATRCHALPHAATPIRRSPDGNLPATPCHHRSSRTARRCAYTASRRRRRARRTLARSSRTR